LRAEHRFGEDINASTGALMPASILMSLPVYDGNDLVLSELVFTQFFSENFAVFAGKAAAIEGDPNWFAAGRGREQFSNLALVANPVPLNAVPYATLTAGCVWTADPLFNQYVQFLVRNPTDTTTTSGFEELFAEGVTLAAEARLHTHFFGKSGHQLFGGVWTNRQFNALGQDPRILFPPLGIPIEPKTGSWTLHYNFDQYLVVDPRAPNQGWGLFGRAGLSDGNPNPLRWFLSAGVGGTSPIAGRQQDSFGVGWYYIGLSDELGPIADLLLAPRDETGVELYYKAVVTPWCELTADVQVIEPAIRRGATTAVVAGLRANIEF
jgi:porin